MNIRYLLCVVLGLPLFWLSAVSAIGASVPFGDGTWFGNGYRSAAAAEALLRKQTARTKNLLPQKLDREIRSLSMRAFEIEPTNAATVRMLGLLQGEKVGAVSARKTMQLASRLSRRDALTNLWLVEDYGRQNNLDEVLKHLDYALRTSGESRSFLMAALLQGMKQKEMVSPMRKLLVRQPPWEEQFWLSISEADSPLGNALLLRVAEHKDGHPVPTLIDQRLLGNLVQTGNLAGAFRLYREVLEPEIANGRRKGNARGFAQFSTWPPMGWQLASDGTHSAWINPDTGELEATLSGQVEALFARRLVELPPGRYRVSAELAPDGEVQESALHIALECAEADTAKAFRVRVTFQNLKAMRLVDIPAGGCRYFWFDINGSPSGGSSTYEAYFRSASIVPFSS